MEKGGKAPAATLRSGSEDLIALTRKEPAGAEELLLDVAEKLIAERGFPSTTVEDIALGAGVSTEVFHAHFADKSALLRSLHDAFLKRLTAAVDTATRSGSWATLGTKEFMELAVCSLMDHVFDHAQLIRAFLTEGGGELARRHTELGTYVTSRVIAVLAECKGPPPLDRDVAFALTMCIGFAHHRVVVGGDWSGFAFTRKELTTEATRAVLAYLDSRPRS